MDEKMKLKVLNRIKIDIASSDNVDAQVNNGVMPKSSHSNQTNPIYKNLSKFNNLRIRENFSVKDLLR